jgi:hypothetical protein
MRRKDVRVLVEVFLSRPDIAIRKLLLEPGEATPWHVDPCRRFSIALQGEQLTIEDRETGQREAIQLEPGMTGWDEPSARVHRAVNTGESVYEEIVVFLIEPAGIDYQPEVP